MPMDGTPIFWRAVRGGRNGTDLSGDLAGGFLEPQDLMRFDLGEFLGLAGWPTDFHFWNLREGTQAEVHSGVAMRSIAGAGFHLAHLLPSPVPKDQTRPNGRTI